MKPAWSSRHLLIRCISRRRQLVSQPFISGVQAKLEGHALASWHRPPTGRACVLFWLLETPDLKDLVSFSEWLFCFYDGFNSPTVPRMSLKCIIEIIFPTDCSTGSHVFKKNKKNNYTILESKAELLKMLSFMNIIHVLGLRGMNVEVAKVFSFCL